jgi:hypothetical protein
VDAAAIIAASTKVDMPFVMSMQTARFYDCPADWTGAVARNKAVE